MTNGRRAGGPLKTITLAQLLAHPFPEREDLVAPWLRQGESAMLWAPSGIGKSMLALTLALAVAGGGTVLGWTAPKPRPVLYVDGEMHAQDLRDRLAMLAGTVAGCDMEAAARNLCVLSRQFQGGEVHFPDLMDPEDQNMVLKEATKAGAELVILDNFSTLCEVPDENEASAMNPVLGFLLRMKQCGRACILVHHSGKTGTDYRGSSKLATTFEVIIGLHRLDGRAAGDGAGFELRWGKYRGRPSAATRDMEVTLEGTEEGQKWNHKPAAGAELLALVDAVQSCRFPTQRAIASHLGWDPSQVTRLKSKAIGSGAIREAEWDACLAAARGGESDEF